MSERQDEAEPRRRPRLTTAGLLLRDLFQSGRVDFAQLAKRMQVSVSRLIACRDGKRALDLEAQIRLAGLVMELAPEHARRARHLHAQAQSALRVQSGTVESHLTNQSRHWW